MDLRSFKFELYTSKYLVRCCLKVLCTVKINLQRLGIKYSTFTLSFSYPR